MMETEYYGKLSSADLAQLDGLLLKLKSLNAKHKGHRRIRRDEIVPLPEDEYIKLWGYLKHCCTLAASWPNVRKAISVVADKSGRTIEDVREDCIESMTVHVYIYAWRHYEHSDECEYVFSTAVFGYKAWIESQNNYTAGIDQAIEMAKEENNCGRKVCNVNID